MNRYACIFTLVLIARTLSIGYNFTYTKTDQPEGWAAQGGGTTGGAGGQEITVSTFDQLKNEAESTGKKILLVQKGVYSGSFIINSDKSILGVEPGVLIKGNIRVTGHNIIVRNIAIQDNACGSFSECRYGSDAVYIGGGDAVNIWFDHCDISDGQDGNFDVSKGPDNITVTFCKFWYSYDKPHNWSNLIAGSDSETESRGKLNHTYAYCWWAERVDQRQPRGRFGKIHVVNNLYSTADASYACGPGHEMSMLIENNVFNISGKAIQDWGKSGSSSWTSIGNIGTATDMQTNQGTAFTPPYKLSFKVDASEVEALVRPRAGNTMTLGESYDPGVSNIVKNSAMAQPYTVPTKSGWELRNPSRSAHFFTVHTVDGKTVLSSTPLGAGQSFQLPPTNSAIFIHFKGEKAPADIHLPFSE